MVADGMVHASLAWGATPLLENFLRNDVDVDRTDQCLPVHDGDLQFGVEHHVA